MEYLIGVIVTLLAILGFKKLPLKNLPKELGDERMGELEDKLDDLEKREKELEKGVEELKPEEVENYWNKNE